RKPPERKRKPLERKREPLKSGSRGRSGSADGAGEFLSWPLARCVRDRRRLAEAPLEAAQSVAQGARVVVADLGGTGSHEPGECGDELARLIQIGEVRCPLGLRVFGQAALDCGGAHQMDSGR